MGQPIRVLLVDDERDFLETISFWLSAKGYQVSIAIGGEQALEHLKRERPDIVCLDVNMPGIDGIETLRRIRTVHKQLPVILVTASYQDQNKFAGAQALGISGLFPKGGSLSELSQALEVALRTHAKPSPPS